MDNYIFSWMAGVLIAVSHYAEVFGFYLRAAGVNNGVSGLGYSAHVQVATFARVGTLLAFPIIGFLIDKGESGKFVGFVLASYAVTFIGLCTFTKKAFVESQSAETIFFFVVNKINRLAIDRIDFKNSTVPDFVYTKKRLLALSFLSYLIIVGGFFVTFFLSASFPDYRATILMMGPFLTGVGTIVSTTYFDPLASLILEKTNDKSLAVNLIVRGRIYAAFAVLIATIALMV